MIMTNDDCQSKTDEEIARLAAENQDYFLHIVQRYKDKLFRYILRITNISPEEAEDLLQDIFLKAYLNLNDFDSDLKFNSWIYRIAHNHVIDNHRSIKSRAHGNAISLDRDEVVGLASDLDVAKEVDGNLLKENINKALEKLDEKYREVLVLKFLEEKSYQEISDILKRPMGTVASLLNKAKREFKAEYEKQNQ